jgi:cyclopropane fatty-acyl-phospholipid synthase-like methyltransferase
MSDARLFSAAAARNRAPILDVLRDILPGQGLVLEIASGSGEHVVHLASALTRLTFAPSDPSATARESIEAWIAAAGLDNVQAPLALDATQAPWPIARADAVICINMVHIAPWAATVGLFENARAILPPGAPLYLYGPYKRGGAHTAQSNAEFDAALRAQNPAWGVRDLDAVADLASRADFAGPEVIEMPANNLSLIFRRARATTTEPNDRKRRA